MYPSGKFVPIAPLRKREVTASSFHAKHVPKRSGGSFWAELFRSNFRLKNICDRDGEAGQPCIILFLVCKGGCYGKEKKVAYNCS